MKMLLSLVCLALLGLVAATSGTLYSVAINNLPQGNPVFQVVEIDLTSVKSKLLAQPFVYYTYLDGASGLSCLDESSQTLYWSDGSGDIFTYLISSNQIGPTMKTGRTQITQMVCDQVTGDIWTVWADNNATTTTISAANSGLSQFTTNYTSGFTLPFPDNSVIAQALALQGTNLYFVATTSRNFQAPASHVWTYSTQTGKVMSSLPLACSSNAFLSYAAVSDPTGTLRGLGEILPTSESTGKTFENLLFEIDPNSGSCVEVPLPGILVDTSLYLPTTQQMLLVFDGGIIVYSWVSATNTTLPLADEILNMVYVA